MTETCTITITIHDSSDHYHEEDVVKMIWPYMVPWFTRRHGVQSGSITLDKGIEIKWQYATEMTESQREELSQQGYPDDCDCEVCTEDEP